MTTQNKRLLFIALFILAALLVGIWIANLKGPERTPDGSTPGATSLDSPRSEVDNNTLTGTLQDSDDVEKGNLMLVMKDKAVYLNTVRDFHTLVGSEVVVAIERSEQAAGSTWENFRLIDIKKK